MLAGFVHGSAEEALAAARSVLGADFVPPQGVLQTAAIGADGRVIRIGDAAPKSAWDFFLLNLARASADVIITTGKILRDEPTLRYDLEGAAAIPAALHAYRRAIAKRADAPSVVVLSSGAQLDLEHPALHGWAKPTLAIPKSAPGVAERASEHGIEVLALEALSLRSLVDALSPRAACISIEAGPSSVHALYDSPPRVTELWLSRFEGRLPEAARGAPFVDIGVVEACLGEPRSEATREEPSGAWTFRRYAR